MVFYSISLQGFRSFRQEQILDLGEAPGVYFLTGRNLVDKQMGRNATGKSTIWDGLCWALFGRTARGLRGKEVINFEDAEMTRVGVTFGKDESVCEIVRTLNPASLTFKENDGEPEPVDQVTLEKHLGFSYELFLHSCLMGQFGTFFFDLKPGEKLALFTSVLQLGVWLDASGRAQEKVKGLDVEVARKEGELSGVRSEITTLREMRERLGSETERNALRKELHAGEARQLELRRQWQADKAAASGAAQAVEELERLAKVKEQGLIRLDNRKDKRQAEWNWAERQLAVLRERKRQLTVKLAELDGKKCPSCGQTLPEKDRAAIKVTLGMQLADVRREQSGWEGVRDASAKRVAAINARMVRKDRALTEANRRAEEGRARVQGCLAGVAGIARRLAVEEQNVASLRKGLEGITAGRKDIKGRLNQARGLRDRLAADVAAAGQQREFAAAWVDYFKRVRLWLIDRCLLELEVEVNNAMDALGLTGWVITFEVERETKAGEVSRGFNVVVSNPSGDKAKWEAWSGGEIQRLRVAGAAGLAELIRNRTAARFNLEVWDEPTTHLSEAGVAGLLQYLQTRAADRQQNLWLVDHRSHQFGFTGSVCAVKTIHGTRLEVSNNA